MNNIIKIHTKDPLHKRTYGDYREFMLSSPVPFVRRRIFSFFAELLSNLSQEIVENLLDKEITEKNMMEIFGEVIEFIEDNGLLEYFIAMILRPIGESERDKNIDEIAEFLEMNASFGKEIAILTDFFSTTQLDDIANAIHSINILFKKMSIQGNKN